MQWCYIYLGPDLPKVATMTFHQAILCVDQPMATFANILITQSILTWTALWHLTRWLIFSNIIGQAYKTLHRRLIGQNLAESRSAQEEIEMTAALWIEIFSSDFLFAVRIFSNIKLKHHNELNGIKQLLEPICWHWEYMTFANILIFTILLIKSWFRQF